MSRRPTRRVGERLLQRPLGAVMSRRPTIYEALRARLGREPTNAELKADVDRILDRDTCDCPVNGCNDTMAADCRLHLERTLPGRDPSGQS